MNWKFHKHYVFLDLEATCAKDGGIARNERETIEIGAVALDAERRVLSEFQEYIRPVLHRNLTEFCTELTGITQATVDAAAFFPHVFMRFSKWIADFEDVFLFSWGNYDRKQLVLDCRRHGIDYTLPKGFMDFKNLFFKKQKLLKRQGLELTLAALGLGFEGRPHSALSDAKNTARLMRYIADAE
ncbi:MAG: exonuclease domain-containing protein [Leptospiraceae bacterium]|nr:exonuclease domain-containing protein [Leptospiraceae bacterium]